VWLVVHGERSWGREGAVPPCATMPPLGWTKKEAEKRGEIGKGRPRAVELRESVAMLAPFQYADEDDDDTTAPAPAAELEAAAAASSSSNGAAAASSSSGGADAPTVAANGRSASLQTEEPTTPVERPKIWLRAPTGEPIQLCGSLSRFCSQQGLEHDAVVAVLNERAEEHQGWRAGYGEPPAPAEPSPFRRAPRDSSLAKARLRSQPYFRAVDLSGASTEEARAREIERRLGPRSMTGADPVEVLVPVPPPAPLSLSSVK